MAQQAVLNLGARQARTFASCLDRAGAVVRGEALYLGLHPAAKPFERQRASRALLHPLCTWPWQRARAQPGGRRREACAQAADGRSGAVSGVAAGRLAYRRRWQAGSLLAADMRAHQRGVQHAGAVIHRQARALRTPRAVQRVQTCRAWIIWVAWRR